MKIPIVITAFAQTDKTLATYRYLAEKIRNHFPGREIIWAYSARVVDRERQKRKDPAQMSPEEALRQLAARGAARVVVQSLHLLPGKEFHDLQQNIRGTGVACTIGMPLLTTPEDYAELGELLRRVVTARPDKAILILGHGTAHPVWAAYYCLEKILRRKFGERIFVGVVEKFPDSHDLPDQIKNAGFTAVSIIPLFIVTGMHYHRDIVGDGPNSWMTRLTERNLAVESIKHGLGLLPGIENIIIRHITQALRSLGEQGL